MKLESVAALFLLGACATTETVWHKDGAGPPEFRIDAGQCRAQAFSLNPGAPVVQAAIVYNGCMEGKGWVLTRRPKP